MTIITIPMAVLDENTQIQQLAMSAVLKGARPSYVGDQAVYPIEQKYLPLDYAKLCLAAGATVEQYPLFIEVEPSAVVPADIPNASEGLTWLEWCDANHKPFAVAGRTFIGTNANSGSDLRMDELVPVLDLLVHPDEIRALVAAQAPVE